VPWNSKQRRTYQRVLSGLTRSRALGARVRVLTLTSPPGSPQTPDQGRELATRWQVLRKRIQRKFGKVDYFRLRTNEGNGVLHIIYRGPYIPQPWLKRAWKEIHGASIVFIQALRGKSQRIANYLVSNYVSGHHSFMRQSWSWGWVYRGFVSSWVRLRNRAPDLSTAIVLWNLTLRVEKPKWFLDEMGIKKNWVSGLFIEELLKKYPNFDKLSVHRLEMVVRYLVHHPQSHPSQAVLQDYVNV
jgi:hypothetical protein